jgi:hypothetical protein
LPACFKTFFKIFKLSKWEMIVLAGKTQIALRLRSRIKGNTQK